jgi:hypothetical protein
MNNAGEHLCLPAFVLNLNQRNLYRQEMICMVQTFQGYFQKGRFVSPQAATIPEHVEVVIVVTGQPVAVIDSHISKQEQILKDLTQIFTSGTAMNQNKEKNPRILRDADPSKSQSPSRLNGTFKVPDDFNEPLDEMKEYMY